MSPKRPTAESEFKPVAAKKGKVDSQIVPALGRPSLAAPADTTLPKPALPSSPSEVEGVGSRQYMKSVVPWVLTELPKYLTKHSIQVEATKMSMMAPLKISGGAGGATSYKEAWSPENCRTSLNQSNLYEAGGNICWLDPEANAHEFFMPGEDPSWAWVWNASETLFQPFAPDSKGCGSSGVHRIRFPVTLHATWSVEIGAVPLHGYPLKMTPLGGHPFIYAW
jgi:hypothetical protein